MANPNNPFGFRPVTRLGGLPYSYTTYGKPATDAQAIFMGDMLFKVAAGVAIPESPQGYLAPACGSAYSGSAPAPGTGPWLGVSVNYGAASLLTVHQVVDQYDVIFIGQGVTGTTYSTGTHVDKNTNINIATAGSTTTKQSGMAVASTFANTAALDLRTRRIAMIVPNAEGANAIFEVTINNHLYNQGTAGV